MRIEKRMLAIICITFCVVLSQTMDVSASEILSTSDKAVIITKTFGKKIVGKDGVSIIARCQYEYPHIVNTTKSEAIDKINSEIEGQIQGLYTTNCPIAEEAAKEYDQSSSQAGGKKSSLLPFEMGTKYEVTFNQSGLLSFYIVEYEYLGGAHPNSSRKGYTYDLMKGEIQKASDLMVWSDKKIKQYIATAIAKEASKSPESFFMEEVEKLGNLKFKEQFYLEDKGITFFFNPYEIAPYAAGTIETTILYEGNEKLFRNAERFSQAVKTLNSEAYLA